MIDPSTMLRHIAATWTIIRATPPERGMWPRMNLLDGVRRLEYRQEHGYTSAVLSCKGRPLRADEEDEMHAGCGIPDDAERIPGIGQDRVSDYRIGIVGQPRFQVVYRWKEPTRGQA